MNTVRTVAVALAACTALAACGGGGSTQAGSVAGLSPTRSADQSSPASNPASTRPTAWTRQQAASAYLADVAAANADIKAWNALPASGSLAQYTAAAAKVTADLDTQARKLLAGLWPVDVKPLAADLAAKSLTERQYWQSVAGSTTVAEEASAADDPGFTSAAAAAGSAAGVLRIALGLPSN